MTEDFSKLHIAPLMLTKVHINWQKFSKDVLKNEVIILKSDPEK